MAIPQLFCRLGIILYNDGITADFGLREYDTYMHEASFCYWAEHWQAIGPSNEFDRVLLVACYCTETKCATKNASSFRATPDQNPGLHDPESRKIKYIWIPTGV